MSQNYAKNSLNFTVSQSTMGPAGGDLDGYYPNPGVANIQGNPVQALILSSIQDGYVLTWNGTEWLADPAAISFTAGGDLSGSNIDQVVIGLQTNPVKSGVLNSSEDGYILTWHNAGPYWEALPAPVGFSAGYDLSGTATSQTVIGIQGVAISSIPPVDGYILTATSSSAANWQAAPISFTAGGDLSGTNTSQTVIGIDGVSLNITSLTTGNQLIYNGTNWINSALNLAGGINYVTGLLPTVNQVNQSMAGDVTGTTGANTVVKIQGNTVTSGALTDGYFLIATSTSNWASTGLTGDVSASNVTPGLITIISIDGYAVALANVMTGNGLYWNGSDWVNQALNLAGGSNYVTGVLPTANQANQSIILVGDATSSGGTTASATTVVAKINGATVPASGSLTTGNVLQVNGSSALTYAAINLAGGANYVTGTLPSSNQAAQTMGGDVSGTTASATVVALQGNAILSGTLTSANDGYVLTWKNSATKWEALPINSGSVTLAGDVTGAANANTVTAIQGNTVASGSLTKGQFFIATTTSNWAATSLSGDVGESAATPGLLTVTGIQGNTFTSGSPTKGQFVVATTASNYGPVTISGDVSESASTAGQLTVVNINGASVPASGSLTTGNVLQVNGASSLTYAAVNLAGGAGYITGNLPITSLAPGTSAQVLMSNGTPASTWTTVSGDVSITNAGVTSVVAITGASGSVPISSSGNILTWNAATTAPGIKQADKTTNSGAGATLTIQAQNETGTTSTGGTLNLTSGTGTTAAGVINLQTGGTTRITINATAPYITVPSLNASGLVHTDGSGNFTTSALVNADVAAAAAIAVSKLAAGTSAQILQNNGTPTPTWTTVTGDVSITNAGVTTVVNINGASVPASGSLTTGNVLQVSGSAALTYAAVNLAGGANYVTGTLPAGNQAAQTMGGDVTGTTAASTVVKLRGNAVKSQSLGAAQDGYGLTWVNANSDWEARPMTAPLLVNQASHGFTTGQAIYYTGSAWALAQSNNNTTLGIGLVSYIDANDFYLYQTGYMTGLSGLTAGQYYFVSDATPGLLTSTEPTNINSFSNPLFFAMSSSAGLVLPFRPDGYNGGTSSPLTSEYDFLLENDPAVTCTYANVLTGSQITQETWTSSYLIKQINYTYSGTSLTTEVRKIFATDGVTIVGELTINYTYTGAVVSSATITRNV